MHDPRLSCRIEEMLSGFGQKSKIILSHYRDEEDHALSRSTRSEQLSTQEEIRSYASSIQ